MLYLWSDLRKNLWSEARGLKPSFRSFIMSRNHNTNQYGGAWTPEQKAAVWQKGREIPNYSKDVWRHDSCGKVMNWSEHGNRNSTNGWEIDHINPVNNGGGDQIGNLQPLNWTSNSAKSDTVNWRCGQ